EAEPGSARVGDLVQLGRLLRVAGEGEQLRAGEAVCDVDGAARKSIQALDVVGLDLDGDAAHRGLRFPVVVEGRQVKGPAAVPTVEPVRSGARGGLLG